MDKGMYEQMDTWIQHGWINGWMDTQGIKTVAIVTVFMPCV